VLRHLAAAESMSMPELLETPVFGEPLGSAAAQCYTRSR
jgi:hypothetical protein